LTTSNLKNTVNTILQRTDYLFVAFFFVVVFLKWPFFDVGPVWDDAFSVFPAANFLTKHQFDYGLLLKQPAYHQGGPTAHATSLLTLVTAFVLKITGGGSPAIIPYPAIS